MNSGENVVILNYSEWIIQLGLNILNFLLLVLCTKLYIHSPLKTPNYLSLQTNKSWESAYLVDLELQDTNSNCKQNYIQLDLGKWSGITEYTCLCYNNDNVFFTTNKKTICKHNSNDNRYKNTYICKELTKIDPQELKMYNNYKFCGKYSSKKIKSYHNQISNKFITYPNVDNYKSNSISIDEKGIIDIKISKNINFIEEGYEEKGNNLYIKMSKNNLINIYEFNEFITGIHYSNELICACEEMTNINPINSYNKNSRNVYYGKNKQCLRNKNQEYQHYYIDDNFIRTSIIDIDLDNNNLNKKKEAYKDYPKIIEYYDNIKNNEKVDILGNSNNFPFLVAQKYLYGIGCQYYENTDFYFSLYNNFYHNKNMALSIIVFTLITSVTNVIFVSFNLYQSCVDYPLVYLTFCIILVTGLITNLTLTAVYFGYCCYLKKYLGKIYNECRIDFSWTSNTINNFYNFNYQSANKALPIEIGLYEDLNFVFYVSLVMVITEFVILILLIIYFAFNCYRYTFISLKNESGDIIKSRKRRKKDLMDLVKMI